jgi:hypothetical protein
MIDRVALPDSPKQRGLAALRRLLLLEGGLPIVWLGLTVIALVPVWNQRLLPMLDTPNHLALVRGWHSFHDPSYHISDFYDLRVRLVPYFLFYSTIHVLMYVVPIEVANKLFLSAYLILFPLSILAVARAFRRSPWLAIGAFPLAFNQNWIYGFSSYLMGTVFMYFALAALVSYLSEPRRGRLAWLGVSSVLAYFSHVLAWFAFGLMAIALLLLHWRKIERCLKAALVMLPSVFLAFVAYLEDASERAYMKHNGEFSGMFRDFPTSVMEFPRRVLEIVPGGVDGAVLWVLALTCVGLVWWRGSESATDDPVDRRQLRVLLVVLGITYLALPYSIAKPMAWWYVAPRIPSMMAPLLFLLPVGALRRRQRLLLLPVIAAGVVLPLHLAKLYRSFSNRNMPFMRLVERTPRGATVMVVVRGMMRGQFSEEKSGDPATSAPVYWHFSSWPMALHGGYSPYLFDQGIPIVPKTKLEAPPWATPDSFDIRQAPDFDYYLVRQPVEEMEREPSLMVQDRLGDWVLFKRKFRMTDEP